MTPAQQAKLFAKQHGLKIVACSASKTVTISKRIVGDSWYINFFDTYKDVVEFFKAAHINMIDKGIAHPWSTYNYK